MDLPNRIRMIYNVKHRYATHLKFGDKFLTFLTKLVLKQTPLLKETINVLAEADLGCCNI